MEPTANQPDLASLQRELDQARRYQQFLKDYLRLFHHNVITPLTYVTGLSELIQQWTFTHEPDPQIQDYLRGLHASGKRAMEAFHAGFETIRLPLSDPEQADYSAMRDPLKHAEAADASMQPPSITSVYPDYLRVVNTILLQLFHNWRLDDIQESLTIEKCEDRSCLRITIQLTYGKADLIQVRHQVEPATLALTKIGAELTVEKAEGNMVILKLTLPDQLASA